MIRWMNQPRQNNFKPSSNTPANAPAPGRPGYAAAIYLPLVELQRQQAAVFSSQVITPPPERRAPRRPPLQAVPVDRSQVRLIAA